MFNLRALFWQKCGKLNYMTFGSSGTRYALAVAACWLVLCLARPTSARSVPAGAPLCSGPVEDDPRAARFCAALNTFLELYAEAAGEQIPEYQALVRDYPQLLDTGMKRQDVVHSFLRFGRRR